MLEFAVMG